MSTARQDARARRVRRVKGAPHDQRTMCDPSLIGEVSECRRLRCLPASVVCIAFLVLLGVALDQPLAQPVELVLPSIAESVAAYNLAVLSPTRMLFGQERALCDFDLGTKDLACQSLQGDMYAIAVARGERKEHVFFLTYAGPDRTLSTPCSTFLHAYDPEQRSLALLTKLDLPLPCTSGESGKWYPNI